MSQEQVDIVQDNAFQSFLEETVNSISKETISTRLSREKVTNFVLKTLLSKFGVKQDNWGGLEVCNEARFSEILNNLTNIELITDLLEEHITTQLQKAIDLLLGGSLEKFSEKILSRSISYKVEKRLTDYAEECIDKQVSGMKSRIEEIVAKKFNT